MIDLGFSTNIIQLWVVKEMQLIDQIISKVWLISEFNKSREMTRKEVILNPFAEGVVKETPFQVVVGDMVYNAILGRP